jgi:hypothetical protein
MGVFSPLPDADAADNALAALTAQEPFVFLLLHPSVYDRHRAALLEVGFSGVTGLRPGQQTAPDAPAPAQKRASQAGIRFAQNRARWQKKPVFRRRNDGLDADGFPDAARSFAAETARFSTGRLSNGVGLVVYDAKERGRALVALDIAGGERRSPENLWGLESALAALVAENLRQELLARNLRAASVSVETTRDYSVIVIDCEPEDARACIAACARALISGEVTPARADDVVRALRFDHRLKSSGLDAQLENAALRSLYADTGEAKLYAPDEEILSGLRFASILEAYPKLLDPSRLRVLVAGPVPGFLGEIQAAAEESFGGIKENAEKPSPSPPSPRFFPGRLEVTLRRRFFSSGQPVPPDGSVPFLRPTTDFRDPLHLYFPAPPESPRSVQVFNALLFQLESMINLALQASPSPAASSVTARPATLGCPLGALKFQSVRNSAAIAPLLESARAKLSAGLTGKESSPWTASIKSRWASRALAPAGDAAGHLGLALESLYNEGSAVAFLEDYAIMADVQAKEFAAMLGVFGAGALRVSSDDGQ